MVIICLVVWALLLGPIGAVFAVPLTACMKIVVHNINHPYAKVGVMMRRDGQIVDAWLSGDFCCVHIHDKDNDVSTRVVLSHPCSTNPIRR